MARRDMTETAFRKSVERHGWRFIDGTDYVEAVIGGKSLWVSRSKGGETRREQLAFLIKRFGERQDEILRLIREAV